MRAVSPVFTVEGLEALDLPLLGVTLGMIASAACGLFPLGRGRSLRGAVIAREALAFKAFGVLVALATWWRWLAIDGTDVAVVLALALVSVPIVLFLSPLLVGRHLERGDAEGLDRRRVRVAGALTLIAAG